jgi:AcrR family transcriptional regulator
VTAPARRGRRPGAPDTRAAVLAAAREEFAAHGFRRTTIRAVAAGAGVDPALVHHYFGSKDDLFVAALQLPLDPRTVIGPALAGGVEGAAERLLAAFLSVWDDPRMRAPLLVVARGMLEPEGHRLMREGFLPAVILPAVTALGVEDPERRMSLVASQALGLILARYVLEIEPLASMPAADVVAAVAPNIQRYLDGPLPSAASRAHNSTHDE